MQYDFRKKYAKNSHSFTILVYYSDFSKAGPNSLICVAYHAESFF